MRITPKPRWAEIRPVVGYPARGWRRLIEVMAINRGVSGESVVDPANQLSLVGPVPLGAKRQRARVFRNRPLQVWHGGKPVPARDGVDLAIPGPAAKAVIQPFDGWARQAAFVAVQQLKHLPLKPAVIALGVEQCRTRGRIKLAVETPQDLGNSVFAVEKVEEIAKNLAASAVNRDRVPDNSAGQLLSLRTIMENTGISVSVRGKKIAMCGLNKFGRKNDRAVVFVDNIQRKTFPPCDLCRDPYVGFLCSPVDIYGGSHTVTAQKSQDEARVIAARQGATHAITKGELDYTKKAIEQRDTLSE